MLVVLSIKYRYYYKYHQSDRKKAGEPAFAMSAAKYASRFPRVRSNRSAALLLETDHLHVKHAGKGILSVN